MDVHSACSSSRRLLGINASLHFKTRVIQCERQMVDMQILLRLLVVDSAFSHLSDPIQRGIRTVQDYDCMVGTRGLDSDCTVDVLHQMGLIFPEQIGATEGVQDGLTVRSKTYVRGCGLVCSAYGMLHCPSHVRQLLTKWVAGPWAGRLRVFQDFITHFEGFSHPEPESVRTHEGDQAIAIGRATRALPPVNFCNTDEGLAALKAALGTLQPRTAGVPAAALLLPVMPLPRSFESYQEVQRDTIKRGDNKAFAQLYSGLMGHVRRLLGGHKDDQLVDDLKEHGTGQPGMVDGVKPEAIWAR